MCAVSSRRAPVKQAVDITDIKYRDPELVVDLFSLLETVINKDALICALNRILLGAVPAQFDDLIEEVSGDLQSPEAVLQRLTESIFMSCDQSDLDLLESALVQIGDDIGIYRCPFVTSDRVVIIDEDMVVLKALDQVPVCISLITNNGIIIDDRTGRQTGKVAQRKQRQNQRGWGAD